MLQLTGLIGFGAAILWVASGYIWQQAYSAGQQWQRKVGNRLVEQTEREHCLRNADLLYEDYRGRTEGTKKK